MVLSIEWCDLVIVAHHLTVAMKIEDEWPVGVTDIKAAGNADVRFNRNKEIESAHGRRREVGARIEYIVR